MSEEQNSGNNGNHPAYQAILDVLPESLHALVTPKLKEWDAGVTRKFQEIHASYEDLKPYKKLAEHGIDMEYAEQAIILADELQRNPKAVVDRINQSWDLGYTAPGTTPPASTDQGGNDDLGDLDFDLDEDELMKHPKIKALYETVTKMQTDFESQRKQEEEEAEVEEFENYLNELEEKAKADNLPFNRLFVTALMHSGVDGEDAVKQYHQVLAGNTQVTTDSGSTEQGPNSSTTDQPPVVMGGEGTGGAGTPDGSVNFGSMSRDALNKTVEQIIAQANEAG